MELNARMTALAAQLREVALALIELSHASEQRGEIYRSYVWYRRADEIAKAARLMEEWALVSADE